MDVTKLLPLMKAESPSVILKKVVAYNAKAGHGDKAIVRIGLASGSTVQGVPLKSDKAGNVIFAASDKSIGFIDTNGISSVQILNPNVLLEVLTDGNYFEIDAAEVPTSLELKRNLKSLKDFLKENYGIGIQSDVLENEIDTDAEKYQFGQFLDMLQNSIQNVADDSLGRAALETLALVNIRASADKLEVRKSSDGSLVVGINFKNKFGAGFKTDLQTALESSL